MAGFSISLVDTNFEADGNIFSVGTLVVGDFSEDFHAPLSYWDGAHYIAQWRDALTRLVEGKKDSAVVTAMHNPASANFILWWPMYVVGDCVHVQNHVLFMDDIAKPLDESNLYASMPHRELYGEDGKRVSEWIVQLADIKDFVMSQRW